MRTTVIVFVAYLFGALIIVPWSLWAVSSDFSWASAGVGRIIVLTWLFG